MIETEIKLTAGSARQARARLNAAGFRLVHRRVFEANLVLDTADASLRSGGRLLRLRQAGSGIRLTFKGPVRPGPHKSREELEIGISDLATAERIFAELGYRTLFRYEKFRTEYKDPRRGGGLAMVDETPVGVFLELEGAPDWIDRQARRLGYSPADYITLSYGALYLEYRKRNPESPANMVFSRPPAG